MSVRLAVAGQAIANDDLVAKISRFETSDLRERHKAVALPEQERLREVGPRFEGL